MFHIFRLDSWIMMPSYWLAFPTSVVISKQIRTLKHFFIDYVKLEMLGEEKCKRISLHQGEEKNAPRLSTSDWLSASVWSKKGTQAVQVYALTPFCMLSYSCMDQNILFSYLWIAFRTYTSSNYIFIVILHSFFFFFLFGKKLWGLLFQNQLVDKL